MRMPWSLSLSFSGDYGDYSGSIFFKLPLECCNGVRPNAQSSNHRFLVSL